MMNNPFVYAFLSPESDDKIKYGELPDESLKRKNKAPNPSSGIELLDVP